MFNKLFIFVQFLFYVLVYLGLTELYAIAGLVLRMYNYDLETHAYNFKILVCIISVFNLAVVLFF